jgi:hypothetical protein
MARCRLRGRAQIEAVTNRLLRAARPAWVRQPAALRAAGDRTPAPRLRGNATDGDGRVRQKLATAVTPPRNGCPKIKCAHPLAQVAGSRTLAADAVFRRQGDDPMILRSKALAGVLCALWLPPALVSAIRSDNPAAGEGSNARPFPTPLAVQRPAGSVTSSIKGARASRNLHFTEL